MHIILRNFGWMSIILLAVPVKAKLNGGYKNVCNGVPVSMTHISNHTILLYIKITYSFFFTRF